MATFDAGTHRLVKLALPSVEVALSRIEATAVYAARAYNYGVFVEAAAWVCLGAGVGYFPSDGAARLLNEYYTKTSVRIPEALRRRASWGNELLAAGYLREALEEAKLPRGNSQDASELAAAFQSAFLLWRSFGGRSVDRFLQELIMGDDDEWGAAVEGAYRAVSVLERVGATDAKKTAAWADDAMWLTSGLISVSEYIARVTAWADTLNAKKGSRDASSAIVNGVARAQVWRLGLNEDRIRARLNRAIEVAGIGVKGLLAAGGIDGGAVWPGGFEKSVRRGVDLWEALTAPTTAPAGG